MNHTLTPDSLYSRPLFRFDESGTDDIPQEVLAVVRNIAAGQYTMREMGLLAQMARAGDRSARKLAAGSVSVGDQIRVTNNISPLSTESVNPDSASWPPGNLFVTSSSWIIIANRSQAVRRQIPWL